MARDYSNRSNSKRGTSRNSGKGNAKSGTGKRSQPASKRKPVAKTNTRKKARRQGATPGWVWLASGLCIGLTLAAVVYIATRPTGLSGRDPAQAQAIQVPESAPADEEQGAPQADKQTAAANSKPRFSFYEMLPDYKVVIPQESYPKKARSSASSSTASSTTTTPSKPRQSKPQPTTPTVNKPGRYIIQAGSFSTPKDANRRKAELTLLGMHAQVLKFTLDSGKIVYRVRSQTIDSNSQLNTLLQRLRGNNIATIVLRQSG